MSRLVSMVSVCVLALGVLAVCASGAFAADAQNNRPASQPVMVQFWENVDSTKLSSLRSHRNYPDAPDNWMFIDTLQHDFSPLRQNFGARIVGYIEPDQTLQYTFWMSALGEAGFWLSTDDDPMNMRQMIMLTKGTRKWDMEETPMQRSEPVVLKKGKRYYFQILIKKWQQLERHLQLEWSGPKMERADVPPSCLRTYITEPRRVEKPANPQIARVSDQMAELTWDAVTDSGLIRHYEVYRDNRLIGEAMARSFIDLGVTPKRTHRYKVRAVSICGKAGRRSGPLEVEIPEDKGGSGQGLRMTLCRGMEGEDEIGVEDEGRIDVSCPRDQRLCRQLEDDDPFSIVWRGFIEPRYDEEYEFSIDLGRGCAPWHMDKARVIIGDRIVIDKWHWAVNRQKGTIRLEAGTKYPIQVQYATGRTGDSVCKLYWKSDSQPNMPISPRQLYAVKESRRTDLDIAIDPVIESHTSPAWVEAGLGDQVRTVEAAMRVGRSWKRIPAERLKGWWQNRFFLGSASQPGIPLERNVPREIELRATGDEREMKRAKTEIRWTPLILSEVGGREVIWLHPGDKLLVQATRDSTFPVTLRAQAKNGEKAFYSRHVRADQDVVMMFAKPGEYFLQAKSVEMMDRFRTTVSVHVVETNPTVIPCEYNYQASFPHTVACEKLLKTKGETKTFCPVQAFDADSLYMARGTNGELHVNPLAPGGDYRYLVRLPDGRGVACGEIQPFKLEYESRQWVRLVEAMDDGTQIVFSRVYMKPHVPNVELKIDAIISGLTLENSRTHMKVSSNEIPLNEEGGGEYKIYILRDKEVANKYCHLRQGYFYGHPVSYRE